MAWTDKRIPPGPTRPKPLITGRERAHNPADDHGVPVPAPPGLLPGEHRRGVAGPANEVHIEGQNQMWRN